MNKKIWGVLVAVLVLVSISLIYVKDAPGGDLNVGVIAPMTGEFAVFGENMTEGIKLAKEEYEKKNPGMKINLIIEDDEGTPAKAVGAFRKLENIDHITAFISATLAGSNDSIYESVRTSGIPSINIGVSGILPTKDNVFQTSPDGNQSLVDFAHYIFASQKFTNTAIVYENSVAGNSFHKAFADAYNGQKKSFENQGLENLRSIAAEITSADFDSVVFLMNPESGALLTKEILALKGNKKISLIYDAQLQTGFADYQRILGDIQQIDGAISMYFKGGDTSTFAELFVKKYGKEPGFLADFGYDTFMALVENYNKDDVKWVEGIQNTKLSGPSGEMSFDQNGVRVQPIEIKTVQNGIIVGLN